MKSVFRHIVLHEDTYENLKLLGRVPDSFDAVIRRLIETEKHRNQVNELVNKAAMGQTLEGHDPIAVVEHESEEAETTLG